MTTRRRQLFPVSVAGFVSVAMICTLGGGCAIPAGKLGEPGTLHAGEVVQVLTRDDILGSQEIHESLNKSGVIDSAITDGSVVVVRLFCCGPPNTSNPHGALNPQALPLKEGDVVEFLLPGGSNVNSVTRVLQHPSDIQPACSWQPKDENLWRRVLYCDWMPQKGWVKQEGIIAGWYKPAGSQ
jgi:hypothetical protein